MLERDAWQRFKACMHARRSAPPRTLQGKPSSQMRERAAREAVRRPLGLLAGGPGRALARETRGRARVRGAPPKTSPQGARGGPR